MKCYVSQFTGIWDVPALVLECQWDEQVKSGHVHDKMACFSDPGLMENVSRLVQENMCRNTSKGHCSINMTVKSHGAIGVCTGYK